MSPVGRMALALVVCVALSSCATVYNAPPLAAGAVATQQRMKVGLAVDQPGHYSCDLEEIVFSPDGESIAWVAKAERSYGGQNTWVQESRSRVVIDGAPRPETFFAVEGLRFLPDGRGIVYKASVIRDNRERWSLYYGDQVVADDLQDIGEIALGRNFYAGVLNGNASTAIGRKRFSVLINGRVAANTYDFVKSEIAAAPATGKVYFAAAVNREENGYRVFCTDSNDPITDELEDVAGPSVDPASSAVYFGGQKANRWALYRGNEKVEGDYDEMKRPVVTSGIIAYAARKGGSWSLVVNGKECLSGVKSWTEIAVSPDGKHLAYVADTGSGNQLFMDGKPLSPPLLYIGHITFGPDGKTVLAVGESGRRSGNVVSELQYFVMANGVRITPLFSSIAAYAFTGSRLRFAGFNAWDDAVVVGAIDLAALASSI